MSTSFRGVKVCWVAVLAMTAFVGMGELKVRAAGEDINALFQMGKAAYYKGDLETAQQILSQVAAREPRHFETRALLAQIRTQLKPNGSSLKRTYEGVTLAKIEFADVTLQEALDGLRAMSKSATEGKVIPNFIVKDEAIGTKTISLNLSNIPLTQVIQYLADVAGAKTTYDQHAVIFSNPAS